MIAIIWYEDQNHVPRVRKIPELLALHLDWTGGRIVLDAKTTSD